VDPVPDALLLRKSGIDAGPLDLQPGTLTTRPQKPLIMISQLFKDEISGSVIDHNDEREARVGTPSNGLRNGLNQEKLDQYNGL
jgi:hypothetical protein